MRALISRFLAAAGGQRILLLRHAEVRCDHPGKRFIGQHDLPLSDTGRRQARYWADCLSGLPLERIVSSDLGRCMQTAQILARGGSAAIVPLPGLREIHLGRWENLSFAQVATEWPDAFRQRGLDLARFRPPDGESFADLQQRVVAAFNQVVDHAAGHTLMVGHAGVNRVLICHLLGMPLSNLFHIAQDCGAMNLIEGRPDGFRIQALNLAPDPCAIDATAVRCV